MEILNTNAWLSPKGEIIEIPTLGGHNTYAHELLIKEKGFREAREFLAERNISATEYLHEQGWVVIRMWTKELVISGNCIDLTKPMRNTIDPPMNERQIRVAKEICKQHNISLHNAINERKFHQ